MGFCARTVPRHDRCCQLNTHKLQQCNRCHRTSITAGTIFDSTKLPLTVWFQGIYLMTGMDKKGMMTPGGSAMKLHVVNTGVGISYNAAWRMRQLMQVMMERDRRAPAQRLDRAR